MAGLVGAALGLAGCGGGVSGTRGANPAQTTTSTPAGGRYRPGPSPPAAAAQAKPAWRLAWGSTMGWGYGTVRDTTIRQLVSVAIGGTAVRIRISNRYGTVPLVVGAATVAPGMSGPNLAPGVVPMALTFSGSPSTTVAPGQSVYSDPAALVVAAGQDLAVSVFVSGRDLMTVHPCCRAPAVSWFSYNGAGNLTASPGPGLRFSSAWSRLVDAVDVLSTAGGTIVVLGDSITDGYNSTARWTDLLQRRIDELAPAERRAVVNEALTANTLTAVPGDDEAKGGGPPGLARLGPDALDQSGVSDVVVLLGTNDLWFGAPASQVTSGLADAARAAHRAGKRILAVTLLPRRTGEERWTSAQQSALVQVDSWILRNAHDFDEVLDLGPAVADVYNGACRPEALDPAFDSGDHLHPNAAGDLALANAVDTSIFGLAPAPRLAPTVAAVPTPGCTTPGPGFPLAGAPAP